MTLLAVGPEHDGRRLDVVLADLLDESRSRAAARIDRGEVRVGGRVAARAHLVAEGEELLVGEPASPAGAGPAPALPPVRYEDEHLLVVAKPAGLVVHPGHGKPSGTLVDALRAAGVPLASTGDPERPGIVHRLDRDTSGLLLVACSEEARAGLVAALQRRAVDRSYLALVDGAPSRRRARIDAPLGRDPRDRVRFAVVEGGRPATTRYRVRREGRVAAPGGERPVALLSCRLETGRTHQIRVHLSSIGHPVVGDRAYGGDREAARALGLERPFLHAAALGLDHPVTGRRLELREPLPPELRAAGEAAGLGALDDVDAEPDA